MSDKCEMLFFANWRYRRGAVSYPLFLWITMCMSVIKVATSESGCGLRLVCPHSRLF